MYLNCHSFYSMRYGTLSPEKLVVQAKNLGIKRLALTDINITSGIFDFVKECKAVDIEPVVGVEFRNDDQLRYICLAQNHAGYAEINEHLTAHLLSETPFPSQSPNFQNVYVIYPLETLESYQHLQPNEFVGVRYWEFNKLFSLQIEAGCLETRPLAAGYVSGPPKLQPAPPAASHRPQCLTEQALTKQPRHSKRNIRCTRTSKRVV
jgi:hypothetical protein